MRPQVKPTRLDRAIGYLSPGWSMKRLREKTRLELAMSYRGAESSRLRSDWILSQTDTTPDSWELDQLRERSRDLNRNDPIASGATDTMGINIVGQGLKPQARLRHEYLGITPEAAKVLQRQAEVVWQDWTLTADNANRLDFNEIQFLALKKIVEDGEILALPVMAPDPWRKIKRAVELLEADRLQPQTDMPGNTTGIDVGKRGEPTHYHISVIDNRKATPLKPKVRKVKALDAKGRPRVLHVFQTKRPGQLRGVPLFAPVLTYFKDLADYLEAEVVAARVAACLAVFVTTGDQYGMAYGSATDTEPGTGNRLQGIEPGLVHYMGLGEEIQVVDPKRPGDAFGPFIENILRIIGVSLNLPYELLVKDFSKTNYSSARAALLEGRRMFQTWRTWFARKFCQPIYDLVLEEAYLRGLFEAPDFYKYRSEYTRALWIGGGWGWVDPVKEVEASRKAIDYGLSTLAKEVAAQGDDWEEVLEQKAREDAKAKELGVTISSSGSGAGKSDTQNGNTEKGGTDDNGKTQKE